MRQTGVLFLFLSFFVLAATNQRAVAGAVSRADFDLNQQVNKARSITRIFAHDLKATFTRALKIRGAAAAVGAYHDAAPEIAARQSEATGFEVRRIALKLRNPENEAVDWERDLLLSFVESRAKGAAADELEKYELVPTRAGDYRFRYMKAIVVKGSCLQCHGADVKQNVRSEIAKYYNDDKSHGFRPGDVIGAYSLVKIIE